MTSLCVIPLHGESRSDSRPMGCVVFGAEQLWKAGGHKRTLMPRLHPDFLQSLLVPATSFLGKVCQLRACFPLHLNAPAAPQFTGCYILYSKLTKTPKPNATSSSCSRQLDAIGRLPHLRDPSSAFEQLMRQALVGTPNSHYIASLPPLWVRDAEWRSDVRRLLGSLEGLNDSQRR